MKLREMETVTMSPSILRRAGGNQQEGGNVNMAWAHSYIGAAATPGFSCPSPPVPNVKFCHALMQCQWAHPDAR